MARQPIHSPWTDDDTGVRVLVECEPADSPTIVGALIERHGFSVRTCEGPRSHRCPQVEGRSCELVAGADVVVNLLREPTTQREVLDAVAGARRPPAIVTEAPRSADRSAARPGSDPDHPWRGGAVTVLTPPVDGRKLIGGIRDALRHRDRPPAWWGDGLG